MITDRSMVTELVKLFMSMITQDIDCVLTTLRQGGIAAIPTETVYGLAGNTENDAAIAKIYALKQRPLDHPLIMHIAQDADLSTWAIDIPDYVAPLIAQFWPGPLTLVLTARPSVINPKITGGQKTVAIRCPKHPLAQTLLSQLPFPLVAPSANPFGKISPTTAKHVQTSFPDQELLILDGGRCPVGIESTIVAAVNPNGYQILRHGMIDEQQLSTLLPRLKCPSENSIRSPGALAQHYQPEKPLYYFTCHQKAQDYCEKNGTGNCEGNPSLFILTFSLNRDQQHHYAKFLHAQIRNTPQEFAHDLYFKLREADASCANTILIELPPDTHAWQGVRERIMKAGVELKK